MSVSPGSTQKNKLQSKALKPTVVGLLLCVITQSMAVVSADASNVAPNPRNNEGGTEKTWELCIKAAADARSERDLTFFRGSRSLSDAKSWFVRHSVKNEKLFCDAVAACNRAPQKPGVVESLPYSNTGHTLP